MLMELVTAALRPLCTTMILRKIWNDVSLKNVEIFEDAVLNKLRLLWFSKVQTLYWRLFKGMCW